MIQVLFCAPAADWGQYETPLRRALDETGLAYTLSPQCADPQNVDYLVYAPGGPIKDFTPYSQAKAVLSLWAGVERIVGNDTLTMPLARMVDSGLSEGMREWVMGHVLRHHLGMDRHILGQNGQWQAEVPPLARNRTIGILGLGALGQTCAAALAALNFNVLGWSRSQKTIADITCYSGDDGLNEVLTRTEILVLLLPQTAQTRHIMNAEMLAKLPRDAVIINPGRGPLIDDAALLAALNNGHIAHATLDVFEVEPLPADHPYWAQPGVTVTPHIASQTRPDTASEMIAQNIRRCEDGAPLLHQVDRKAGY
ncbi:MAG: glyoxylate/hydroxypyruvate reductase A [Robiginitomaculum sp.]|nr:MAG: glyoxylate/hydroxypyruvate reductase A [Robiginitomaculum sp.]